MTPDLTAKAARGLAFATLSAFFLAGNSGAADQPPKVTPRYVVIDLGTDMVNPRKITNSGYVQGDNHKSSFYIWFDGVVRELKPEKPGDILTVEDINEAGTAEGSETKPAPPGGNSRAAYHAAWSKDATRPRLTLAASAPETRADQTLLEQIRKMILPQGATSAPVTPQWSNAAVVMYPAQSGTNYAPAQLVAATQVIGNGADGPVLWEMKPTRSGTSTFDGPRPINYLLPGGPKGSPWNVTSVSSINDGGTIVGTALYKPTGPNDTIAAGLHGVMLMPMAIVRETTPGSGVYGPITDNGLDDEAVLPIYRTESGKGVAATIKRNSINAVLFHNLSSNSVSTLVVGLENKVGDSDEGKLIETAAGSGVFRDESKSISVILSPVGQTTSDATVDSLGLLVNDSELGLKDEAFTLKESSTASNSFSIVPDEVVVILSKPLSASAINTIQVLRDSEDFPSETIILTETAINSRVFRGAHETTLTVTRYSRLAGGSMNVAITSDARKGETLLATLAETSLNSLQYCNVERVSGDAQVSTPESDGQGIFYIQMPGTTPASITVSSGNHHVTVWAKPVKGQPNLLRTGKLVLIEHGDPFRAPDITVIEVGSSKGGENPTVEFQKYQQTIVK